MKEYLMICFALLILVLANTYLTAQIVRLEIANKLENKITGYSHN